MKNADGNTEQGVGDGDALLHGKVNHIEICMFVSIFSVDLNGLRTLRKARAMVRGCFSPPLEHDGESNEADMQECMTTLVHRNGAP